MPRRIGILANPATHATHDTHPRTTPSPRYPRCLRCRPCRPALAAAKRTFSHPASYRTSTPPAPAAPTRTCCGNSLRSRSPMPRPAEMRSRIRGACSIVFDDPAVSETEHHVSGSVCSARLIRPASARSTRFALRCSVRHRGRGRPRSDVGVFDQGTADVLRARGDRRCAPQTPRCTTRTRSTWPRLRQLAQAEAATELLLDARRASTRFRSLARH